LVYLPDILNYAVIIC